MVKLSPHFTLSEFVKSTRGEQEGLINTPDKQAIVNMSHLCYNVLNKLKGTLWHKTQHFIPMN